MNTNIRRIFDMKAPLGCIALIWVLTLTAGSPALHSEKPGLQAGSITVALPDPQYRSTITLPELLSSRRSIRRFLDKPVPLAAVSKLLWAAQGITNERGFRTAPSAGALYPLEMFIVTGPAPDLVAGMYRYEPKGHQLLRILSGDFRARLSETALNQTAIRDAPLTVVISAVFQRTQKKYINRGSQYVYIEVGHAAQNLILQAESLELGTVPIGAFHDDKIASLLNLTKEKPLYLIPVGYPPGLRH
jgi:SagB-type dehydrogenase family enzyme